MHRPVEAPERLQEHDETIAVDMAAQSGDSKQALSYKSLTESNASQNPQPGVPGGEELAVGTIIAGKYEIQDLLGKGGMSAVYRARHLEINKILAIKVLSNKLLNQESSLRRFRQEAQAASKFNHSGIVGVFDCGTSEAGLPYLVMEYVEGRTLSELLKSEGVLELERFLTIMNQVIDALAHAHEHSVIHRDLKPSNIMLTQVQGKEQVRVLDFGIAKIVHEQGEGIQQLTQTGEVFGSPLYMSPEQCSGSQIGRAADIYSLGCVMFELLSGKPPHQGATVYETIHKHLHEEPPSLKAEQIPAQSRQNLELILLRCLAKNADDRYQSMSELKSELRKLALSSDTGLIAKIGSAWSLASAKRRAAQRSKMPALVAALTISMCSVGLMLYGFVLERKQVHDLQKTSEIFDTISLAQSEFVLLGEATRMYFASIVFQRGDEAKKVAERKFKQTSDKIRKRLKELDSKLPLDSAFSKTEREYYRQELERVPRAAEVSARALERADWYSAGQVFNAENIAIANKLSKVAEAGSVVLQDIYRQAKALHRAKLQKYKESSQTIELMFYSGAAINGLVFLGLFLLFRKDNLERMRKLAENAKQISRKQGIAIDAEGVSGDEIEALDNVLSELASALSEAEERERALLEKLSGREADASITGAQAIKTKVDELERS